MVIAATLQASDCWVRKSLPIAPHRSRPRAAVNAAYLQRRTLTENRLMHPPNVVALGRPNVLLRMRPAQHYPQATGRAVDLLGHGVTGIGGRTARSLSSIARAGSNNRLAGVRKISPRVTMTHSGKRLWLVLNEAEVRPRRHLKNIACFSKNFATDPLARSHTRVTNVPNNLDVKILRVIWQA
jgi:hypothetical protein